MKKSILIASLAVISMDVLGIHDHPRINKQDHFINNLTPVSNIETTSDGSDSIDGMSNTEIIDEGNYSGATQEQGSSRSKKRRAIDEFEKFRDKRRRMVTLHDTRNSLQNFINGHNKKGEVQLSKDIANILMQDDYFQFFSKTLQLQQEVKKSKSFIAKLSSMLRKNEEENISNLLGHEENIFYLLGRVEKLQKDLSKSKSEVEDLKENLNKSKSETDKLKQKNKEAEQQIAAFERKKAELAENLSKSQEENRRLHQETESFQVMIADQNATIKKEQKEKEQIIGKLNELKTKFNDVQTNRMQHKSLEKLLKKEIDNSKREYQELLSKHNKELKISEYTNDLYKKRIDFLLNGSSHLNRELDLKHNARKFNRDEREFMNKIHFNLEQLQSKEWIITQLLLIERTLTDFFNTVIFYKQGMSISAILEEFKKNTDVSVDKELSEQNFKNKLNDFFKEKDIKGTKQYYTKYEKQFEVINKKYRKGNKTSRFNDKIFEDIKIATNEANEAIAKMKNGIDEKIAIIRNIREEKVIQDFIDQIKKVNYFNRLISFMDKDITGYYEALLRIEPYESIKK